MKIFETPEMKISVFESENVIMASDGSGSGQQVSAAQQAINIANDGTTIVGSAGTLSLDFSE